LKSREETEDAGGRVTLLVKKFGDAVMDQALAEWDVVTRVLRHNPSDYAVDPLHMCLQDGAYNASVNQRYFNNVPLCVLAGYLRVSSRGDNVDGDDNLVLCHTNCTQDLHGYTKQATASKDKWWLDCSNQDHQAQGFESIQLLGISGMMPCEGMGFRTK